MDGIFFLDFVWTRELLRMKSLCVGYTHNFFHKHSNSKKTLQRNEVEVRPLFHPTSCLKLMKIRNFKNQLLKAPKSVLKFFSDKLLGCFGMEIKCFEFREHFGSHLEPFLHILKDLKKSKKSWIFKFFSSKEIP